MPRATRKTNAKKRAAMKAAKARTNLKTDLAAEGARLRERAVSSDARRGDYPASLQRAQRGSCGVIFAR
jgi:hypothetical protein